MTVSYDLVPTLIYISGRARGTFFSQKHKYQLRVFRD